MADDRVREFLASLAKEAREGAAADQSPAWEFFYKEIFPKIRSRLEHKYSVKSAPKYSLTDVAQEAAVRLFEMLKSGEGCEKLSDAKDDEEVEYFLIAMCHFRYLTFVARHYERWHTFLDAIKSSQTSTAGGDIRDDFPNFILDELIQKGANDDSDRTMIAMLLQGYSTLEIAPEVGLDVRTVRRRLKSIRKRLIDLAG